MLRRIMISFVAVFLALGITGCKDRTAEKKAEQERLRQEEIRKYKRTESADYIRTLKNEAGDDEKTAKNFSTTMTLYGMAVGFSLKDKTMSIGDSRKKLSDYANKSDCITVALSGETYKKALKLNVGDIVKMKGKLNMSELKFTPVSISKADKMCDYFGRNVPSGGKLKPVRKFDFEDFQDEIQKNSMRFGKKYNGKVISLKGPVVHSESDYSGISGSITRSRNDDEELDPVSVSFNVAGSRSQQKTLSYTKNGDEVTVTGRFSLDSMSITA